MAKRFTDTEKWKKPFIRALPAEYKLLWFYMLDDCDIAGLWQVDLEIAEIRIGSKLDRYRAIELFGDHIIVIPEGDKWFVPSFLDFQYGSNLSKTNNVFNSIDKILKKYDLYDYINITITDEGTTISSFRNRVSKKVKDKILFDASLICQYCSEQKMPNELVVDHFIPLSKGGDNSDDNLICCCVRCNTYKKDILPDDFVSRSHSFLKPTNLIIDLIGAYKKLKEGYKGLLVPKDKDMVKDKVKVMDLVKDKESGKKKLKNFNCSESELPSPLWERWKKFKYDEFKYKYKSEDSENMAKTKLYKLSGGDPAKAQEIVEQSITNGWKGFFELKNNVPKNATGSKVDNTMENGKLAADFLKNMYKNKDGQNSQNNVNEGEIKLIN